MEYSALQKARYGYSPKLPGILRGDVAAILTKAGRPTEAASARAEIKAAFPKTYGMPEMELAAGSNPQARERRGVGVVLSGGQAPGGHNVIAGLFDALKAGNPDSQLVGFLGGPQGIVDGKSIELTAAIVDGYRNTGGFEIIGSGRTKLETPDQFEKAASACKRLGLSALVVVGGDDSNTNAAVLAEHFLASGEPITVVGVPKTIDGDLKNAQIETSFGFDTATKTYAELIGNIERDAGSAKKYWHFVKLMGRSASHIALECALQTRPNLAIISEEVERKRQTLAEVVEEIAGLVAKRAEAGDNFGVALIPEGLIEFIPEFGRLIAEINELLARSAEAFAALSDLEGQLAWLRGKLSAEAFAAFSALPREIQAQLLSDRDPHGNVQVSHIETEKLLTAMVGERLEALAAEGKYSGKFSPLHHFFGYEGRCAFPSNFDADYCYSLGYCAFLLLAGGRTGYMAVVRGLSTPAEQWKPGGIPLTTMMDMEERHGKKKAVIKKALVDLAGKPFKAFAEKRVEWSVANHYLYPGAIQYFGPPEVCDQPTITLRLERS